MLLGYAHGEPVILVRRGDDVFGVGATCTHSGAPLVDGLVVGETLRCPWHHACFDLRNAVPLRTEAFYREHAIGVKLATRVVAIDTGNRDVQLADGSRHRFDALLLATGAEPVRLDVPGADLPHVHDLRTAADSRALVDSAMPARHAVVIGSSFIGLEVAASLRARHVGVHVVGREAVLMERVLGAETGAFIRQVHERHGVTFHLARPRPGSMRTA